MNGSYTDVELARLRAIKPAELGKLLVQTGLIPRAAIWDQDGYDGGLTWERIVDLSKRLEEILYPELSKGESK